MNVPEQLKYTDEHEWVQVTGDGVVRIGITDYAQSALGDVVFVQPPSVGETVKPGDSVGEVESTKSVSDIYAPLAGEVTAVNEVVVTAPETINSDPYGDGWLFELRLDDAAALEQLLDAAAYAEKISEA
ncbi:MULTISPECIES: glycine cleavage system protein GcvH [unclassified Crossiella]|uniref:glycine cleavage system protein GcvH n=1 Tax=unclassified Crossiella TaxID=2620835 RepID=UPI001FFE9E33|nr:MULTISPECIES: glycine cleavage system protein GcvH [unclassified Crossiella]MCK2242040.1 glycine cleavage system protein GcvH [Crossiella sp. S99.2]MCK2255943.1 glycine cleavage system protein GcvH [Crossiella sp. S99.1]